MRIMTYGQYPFWLKNQADSASADSYQARREASNCKEQLEKQVRENNTNIEKIKTAMIEIAKYKSRESKNISKKELVEILDKLSEILSK